MEVNSFSLKKKLSLISISCLLVTSVAGLLPAKAQSSPLFFRVYVNPTARLGVTY